MFELICLFILFAWLVKSNSDPDVLAIGRDAPNGLVLFVYIKQFSLLLNYAPAKLFRWYKPEAGGFHYKIHTEKVGRRRQLGEGTLTKIQTHKFGNRRKQTSFYVHSVSDYQGR